LSSRELAAAAAAALGEPGGSVTAPWQSVSSAQVTSHLRATDSTGPQWWQPGAARTVAAPPVSSYTWHPPASFVVPPPRPSRRRRRIAITATVFTAAIAAGAVALTFAVQSQPSHTASPSATASPGGPSSSQPATTTAARPGPPVAASALSGFLLPAEQIKEMIEAPTMQVVESSADTFSDGSAYISEKDCAGPYQPGDNAAYANTGSTGSQFQYLQNPGGHEAVQQAVIAYSTADAAQKVLADQHQKWSACAGRTFTLTLPNESPHRWSFSPLTTPDGALVLTTSREGKSYFGCQRALTARNNVIIDVGSCKLSLDKKGLEILNAIAAKIPS
jgi:PknH-like extracellular domain